MAVVAVVVVKGGRQAVSSCCCCAAACPRRVDVAGTGGELNKFRKKNFYILQGL
jgi:hypothetical protein